jgi:Mn2+/Fe2+ NRAMP family transporter
MYDLIFYFFYRYFVYREDRTPKFGAICGILLTIGLHIILVYVIIQKIVGHNLLQPLSQSYYLSKALNMLVILPFFILGVMFFSKKRVDKIIAKYENKNVFTIFNWIIFLTLTIGSILSIYFLLRK